MTLVKFSFGRPSDGGPLPTAGTLRFKPTRERVVAGDPDMIVLPIPFSKVVPKDTGVLDVDLTPSGPGWVWEIYSHSFGVAASYRYVVVPEPAPDPDNPGEFLPVDYTDLVRVDPKTLDVVLEPDPLWWAELVAAKGTALQVLEAQAHVEGIADGIEASLSEMLAKSQNLGDVPSPSAARANIGAAPVSHTHSMGDVAGLQSALTAKADLVGGKVPTSQIPSEALIVPHVVADEAEMLALTPEDVQPGDVAVRTDGAGTFILKDADPSVIGSWVHLSAPTDNVTSVNGQVGAVVLGASDVGAATPQQVADAVGAVEVLAAGFADAAEGSATAAVSAGNAATEKQAAQTARTGAEGARDQAEGFRDETEAAVTTGLSWSGAVTVPTDAPRFLHATLTGNVTLSLGTPGPERAFTVTLALTQDSTGGRTVTIPGARTAWGVAYQHTGTAGSLDMVHLLWTGLYWLVAPAAQKIGVPA